MSRTVSFVGARGGQGTSTVAAAFACLAAAQGPARIVSHDPFTMAHLLGSRAPLPGDPQALGTTLVHAHLADEAVDIGGGLTIIDAGTLAIAEMSGDEDARYAVLRGPCYLSLATLVAQPHLPFDGVVLVAEEGRSLSPSDVVEIVGLPVVATVPVHPRIAQCVDAGVLGASSPSLPEWAELRAVAAVQHSLDRLAPERVAMRAGAEVEPPGHEVNR